MEDIKSLDEIKTITVHWSESELINDVLGCDENSDIEKEVDVIKFDDLIKKAEKKIETGYDKTVLTVVLKTGFINANKHKFYLTRGTDGLLDLLNNH